MKAAKITIKKYENRRLYDTVNSRYVNLDDVARMVRDGVEIEVTDLRTGEDLTRIILTQIIMEDAKGRDSGLPLDLLRQLVQASDRATHDFLVWYLKTAFDMFHKTQEAIQSRLSGTRSAFTNPFEAWRLAFQGRQAPNPTEAEIAELRNRIQELEQRLSDSRPEAKRKQARAKR